MTIQQLAARLHGSGDVRVEEEQMPAVGPGEVLLRVTAVGLCGSDLHWFEDARIGDTALSRPLVLGHEIAAVIANGSRAGTRVAVDPADPCQACATCLSGRAELCAQMRFTGLADVDGGLRSFMAWPEHLLTEVPLSISDVEASLLEALGVALHALDVGELMAGMRCGVVGAGPIGLLVIRALRALGWHDIAACDLLPHRVAAAADAGATTTWAAEADGMGMGAGAATVRDTCDVVFECAGSDGGVETSIAMARPGGRVVLVGIPGSDRTTFTASAARRKGLTLALSRRMTAADLPRAIAIVADGRVSLSSLVTHRYPLSRASEAFEALAERRGLKIVVEPDGRYEVR